VTEADVFRLLQLDAGIGQRFDADVHIPELPKGNGSIPKKGWLMFACLMNS